MRVAGSKAATVALLTANGALALLLWFQLAVSPQEARATPRAAPRPPPLQLPTPRPELPPLSAYQEVTERPLFWVERRAQPEAVAITPDGTPTQMPFVLLGVVQAGRAQALLGRTGSKEVSRVYVGDVVDGWTVDSMTRDSVTLTSNGVRKELQFGNGRTNGK